MSKPSTEEQFKSQSILDDGFFVVRKYSGHGIGRDMHEDPTVLNFGTRGSGMMIKNGFL